MVAKKTRSKGYPLAETVKRDESRQIVPVTKNHKVVVMEKRRAISSTKQDRLRTLEDEMLESSLQTMKHALDFAAIPFDAESTPQDLVDLHGENADKVFRLMKSAQMSAKDAPVGLLLAQRMASSIVKARATEKNKPEPLNVAVQVVVQAPMFEELDVE